LYLQTLYLNTRIIHCLYFSSTKTSYKILYTFQLCNHTCIFQIFSNLFLYTLFLYCSLRATITATTYRDLNDLNNDITTAIAAALSYTLTIIFRFKNALQMQYFRTIHYITSYNIFKDKSWEKNVIPRL
jgi:hypothetical protein